jgi:hypothetical protein
MPWGRLFVVCLGYLFLACRSAPAKAPKPVRVAQVQETLAPKAAPSAAEAPPKAEEVKKEKLPAENPPAETPKPVIIRRAFANTYENDAFVRHMAEEHRKFGTLNRIKKYKKRKFGNSIVEQRSGRRRLYDHNIFLRALFAGKLTADDAGDLKTQFEGALFLDIGSAILFGDGADTVRDLFEDKKVATHLKIVASDINDRTNKKNRYVDIYRNSGEKLPFPVVEIPMMMDKPEHFVQPIKLFLTDEIQAVILRSANAGPDLYYDNSQVQRHLRSAVAAFYDRHLVYFFNKFILYKPKGSESFVILGEIDSNVGINHRVATWEDIEWDTRTFSEAIRLNPQYAEYKR